MSFATWKKRSTALDCIPIGYRAMAELACQAAYKAGERQGRKDAEEAAKMAIDLMMLGVKK